MVKRQRFSDEIWEQNYKCADDNSLEDTWKRQAKACAAVEKPELQEDIYQKFLWLLTDFKGIAGGRITANLGVKGREATTLFNCFVHHPSDFNYKDPDSIEGIYDMLKAQAHTLKSEGGYGTNFSWLRPNGSYVCGIDGRTPGALKFMELWDKSSEIITSGSEEVFGGRRKNEKRKIRKGAQMGCLCVWHPDIEAFIEAKRTKGRFTKFNISVGITPGFMEAVINDDTWDLIFPDVEFERFNEEWDGDIENWRDKNYPIIVWKTVKAKDLWEKITKSTYNYNDPGVLFLDIANRLNPLYYAEKIHTTNPCFHGDERFLSKTGYIKFKDSCQQGSSDGIHTDDRVSYVGRDSDEERPQNWVIDTRKYGTTLRESSPAFVTQEYSDLLELEFGNGQLLRCTPDHHIATTDGMIMASELTPEHQILVSKVTPPENSVRGSVPFEVDTISAFLMGLISGNGGFDEKTNTVYIDLLDSDKYRMKDACYKLIDNLHRISVVKDCKKQAMSLYFCTNEDGKLVNFATKEEGKLRVSSTWLRLFLEQRYNFTSETKQIIPEIIFQNARESIGQHYLAGLYYTNGLIKTDSKGSFSIRLGKYNKDFLRQVQLLCHANGIITNIYLNKRNSDNGGNGSSYELVTTRNGWKNFDRIGFSQHRDKEPVLYYMLNVGYAPKEESYTNLIGVSEIDGDTVYCLKEPHTRSLIANTITARRCGEVLMSTGVCLLFSLNLVKFVKKVAEDVFEFDYETFEKAIEIAIRFADNINDISRTPLSSYAKSMKEKRRIGVGVLALGSLHYALGIRFGSKESLELIRKIFKTKAETEILTSAKLGKEKGSFPLFDREKYFGSTWWKTLPISPDIKRQVEEIGEMRNSHRSANAPTGNMSIYAGVVSGGIEPGFLREYYRWSIVPEFERRRLREKGFEFPDSVKGEWFETKDFKFGKSGTDVVLLGELEGTQYQIDKNRGLTKRTLVEDWGWSFAKENFTPEKLNELEKAGVFVTTDDLTVEDHVNSLSVISPFVDHNSSKTVNVPNDFEYDRFKDVYLKAWKAGIKGITTYRAGTMACVLESTVESKDDKKDDATIVSTGTAPKRPASLPCEVHRPKINGQEWAVIIGLLNEQPYEVFAGPADNFIVPNKTEGKINKKKRGVYSLEWQGQIIEDIISVFDDNDSAWATRLVSMSLRHGIPLKFICEQLSKDGFVTDVNKVMSRILKKYIKKTDELAFSCPKCGSKNINMTEGCLVCVDCGFGKCG